MTIEQKIKEIEGFVSKWDVNLLNKYAPTIFSNCIIKLNQALEVIRELKKNIFMIKRENRLNKFRAEELWQENAALKAQLDRVRDTENLRDIILNNKFNARSSIITVEELQDYILNGG